MSIVGGDGRAEHSSAHGDNWGRVAGRGGEAGSLDGEDGTAREGGGIGGGESRCDARVELKFARQRFTVGRHAINGGEVLCARTPRGDGGEGARGARLRKVPTAYLRFVSSAGSGAVELWSRGVGLRLGAEALTICIDNGKRGSAVRRPCSWPGLRSGAYALWSTIVYDGRPRAASPCARG